MKWKIQYIPFFAITIYIYKQKKKKKKKKVDSIKEKY